MDYSHAKLKPINARSLIGKTIRNIDDSSCNVLLIKFDDGTELAIESHHDFRGVDYCELQEMVGDYPPLQNGTKVITTKDAGPISPYDWTEEALRKRRWGIMGEVVNYHDSHGLCYEVRHEEDGEIACYNPEELKVLAGSG